ncbi:MAG: hypothetical protein WA477_16330 [Candidatus Sulfotelmatobacter sp.]
MRSLFGLMVTSVIILFLGYSGWMHLKQSTDSVELQAGSITEQARKAQQAYSDPQEANQPATVAGPLASLMNHKGDKDPDAIETVTYERIASDHVGGSVVGTSNKVLHQVFAVAGTVDLPFEVPAHAYNPQLHGSFRSFIQAGSAPTTAPGDVDFLLLNDEQYSALVGGHPSDALFSADASHDQEVNANLPPTLNQAVKYHLIFRNTSPKAGKRVVQADFQIDF